jgi:uncharacterized membrane protein (DUF4010 family)
MDTLELFQRLAVALAIGMMIGVERGWLERNDEEGQRTAGLRTLTLTGLLGGITGALAMKLDAGGVLVAIAFATLGTLLAVFRGREMAQTESYGITTIVAGLVAFALGAFAVVGDMLVAAAAAVAATGFLAFKRPLHGMLRKLSWEELRAALLLLAMTLILLPLLPDREMGPWNALNPYELWLMTVLIAGVSSVGYVALKAWPGSQGILLSGLAGGLVSSTAVTLSFSKLAAENPERESALMSGALLAGAVMMLRTALIASSFNARLVLWVVLPLVAGAVAQVALAVVGTWRPASGGIDQPLVLKSPFELTSVLKFGLFLTGVILVGKALVAAFGSGGAYLLAAVSGISDVDAVTLSLSRMAGAGLNIETAAGAILLSVVVNSFAKAGMAAFAGGWRAGLRLGAGAVLATLAVAATFEAGRRGLLPAVPELGGN